MAAYSSIMGRFYREACNQIVDADGLVKDYVGHEVVGLFFPGISGSRHAAAAVAAARGILEATGHGDPSGPWLPVGAGVHTGTAYVGTVNAMGRVQDFTAHGDAVNSTARIASAAAAGELLVSDAAATATELELGGLERRTLNLRGKATEQVVWVLTSESSQA